MSIINQLNWRYATKRYNGKKVPTEKLDNILEAIRLSASSIGLQPYSILVIEDPELRKQLAPAANNQPQITEASHLLVFAAWENITLDDVDEYLQQTAEIRKVSLESLSTLKAYLLNIVNNPAEQNFNWAARQAYIALGTALVAAADEQIDATPMEGFNSAEFDRLLGLGEKRLKSVALLSIGYRDAENDWNANLPKVRRDKEKLFIQMESLKEEAA
ncbi:NAD(P)H-dependent oxidoreductase [Rubrolithibacter danxiaensis]|uniref:NAD(P)H-dependent oxidoreductase n=1 Tax=Rubrolithibacter danxiaensis TaxID=3390805 RepID=UPI003BF7C0CA